MSTIQKITVAVLIVAIAVIVYAVFLSGGGPQFAEREPGIPESAKNEAQTMKEYRGSFVSGYEGSFVKVSYSLKYPSPAFSVEVSPEDQSTIEVKEAGGKRHAIKIFNNAGAGFGSPKEVWEALGLARLCPECKETPPTLKMQGAEGAAAWSSGKLEVMIYKRSPGFVIATFEKPTDVGRVFESFTMSSENSAQPAQPVK